MRVSSGAISDIRRHFVTTLTTDSEPAQVARLASVRECHQRERVSPARARIASAA
jgi:hypothetical protein